MPTAGHTTPPDKRLNPRSSSLSEALFEYLFFFLFLFQKK